MADDLGELRDQAWDGFLRTHERLWQALARGLESVGTSLAEYDVLAHLDLAGPDGLRMSDLAERRLMSTSGLTRLVDRLERRAAVERSRSQADGRSVAVRLTQDGRELLGRARAQHHDDLQRLFFDHLDQARLRQLAEVWAELRPDDRAR